MYNFPIGIIIDSFRCDTYEAIKKAADLKAADFLRDIIAKN